MHNSRNPVRVACGALLPKQVPGCASSQLVTLLSRHRKAGVVCALSILAVDS
jgi:hypothetical protein